MPIHIERITSEITAVDGDLPLNDQQLERLAQRVCALLQARELMQQSLDDATRIRQRASEPLAVEE